MLLFLENVPGTQIFVSSDNTGPTGPEVTPPLKYPHKPLLSNTQWRLTETVYNEAYESTPSSSFSRCFQNLKKPTWSV